FEIDNVTNELIVSFEGINLPASILDFTGSQGKFVYGISPKPGLPDGTQIENFTAILFNGNVPVITNTVINTIISEPIIPSVDAGPDQIVINNEDIVLTAKPSGSLPPYDFLWSTGEITQSITVNPSEPTTFFVTVSASGCEGNTDSVLVVNAIDIACDVKSCGTGKTEMCEDKGDGKGPKTKCVKDKDIQKKLDSGKFTLGACSLPEKVTMCHIGKKDPDEHCVKLKDVDKKLAKGDFVLGPCEIIPPISDGCGCKGGIVEFIVSFNGGAGQSIIVKDADIADNGDGTYTITNGGKKLKSNTELREGGNKIKIHTSCSKPIGIGDIHGNFTVTRFTDTEGNVCIQGGFLKSLDVSPKVNKSDENSNALQLIGNPGDNSNIKVFPNPFSNEINIIVEKDEIEQIEISIYDISGRKVYNSGTFSTNEIITLRMELYPGLSLVRITNLDGTVNTLKIIKIP
ncbi:MAG: T9SS type A sorting domain-containing protein, partial [Bacteroidetes bacterium]|nr:T9SS type A sorting domain-containing protein [Bacteroidota bacterium]